MSGTEDHIKGKAKETAGAATGDRSLEQEGEADQAAGRIKDAAHDLASKVGEGVDKIRDHT